MLVCSQDSKVERDFGAESCIEEQAMMVMISKLKGISIFFIVSRNCTRNTGFIYKTQVFRVLNELLLLKQEIGIRNFWHWDGLGIQIGARRIHQITQHLFTVSHQLSLLFLS